MNVSASYSGYVGQTYINWTAFNRLSESQRLVKHDENLTAALATLGVDKETSGRITKEVSQTLESMRSNATQFSVRSPAVRAAVDSVLTANGVDPAQVGEAIQAAKPKSSESESGPQNSGGPRRGGRPPKDGSLRGGSIETALFATDLKTSEIDDLLTNLIKAIGTLAADDTSAISQDALRSAVTAVLNEGGQKGQALSKSLQASLRTTGNFIDKFA